MRRHIMPDIVQRQDVHCLPITATAFQAATMMRDSNIAAVIIVGSGDKIIGIVTERDLTRRVLANDRNPQQVAVAEIMTKDPDTLSPDDTAHDALELMRTRSYRHLPVVEDGRAVAMVSVRDLYAAIKMDLEDDIQETKDYVFNDRYSATQTGA